MPCFFGATFFAVAGLLALCGFAFTADLGVLAGVERPALFALTGWLALLGFAGCLALTGFACAHAGSSFPDCCVQSGAFGAAIAMAGAISRVSIMAEESRRITFPSFE
nr:hypothetical protein [uncultured Cohaesibacter sp.]